MALHFLFHALLLLASLEIVLQRQVEAVASYSYSVARRSCTDKCGDVTIPFPFGVGSGCFFDEWYEIVCSPNSTTPRLKKLDLEVLNISLPMYNPSIDRTDSTVIVSYPIVHSNSSCGHPFKPVTLYESPLIFSEKENIFFAVGCDVMARMQAADNPSFFGCMTTQCAGSETGNYSACSGVDCCQLTVLPAVQGFSVRFELRNSTINADHQIHGCKFASFVQKTWFQSNKTIDLRELRNKGHVPVVLRWGVTDTNLVRALVGVEFNSTSTGVCSKGRCCERTGYINHNTTSFIQCWCECGYGGNPYLQDGCPSSLIAMVIWPLILCIVCGRCSYKSIKRRKQIKLKKKFFKECVNRGISLQQQLSPEGNVQGSKLFGSKELAKATDQYSKDRVLGQGGQGTVYKGMLTDGKIVAVKKFKEMDDESIKQFINEVVTLSHINHRNIVQLLGICLETDVPLLVYEFIPNGTLYQYLHHPNDEFPLSWDVRVQIASEVAEALSYMHSAASVPIYHRDIKSTNILLDEKYQAKVADFGTSRAVNLDQTHVTTLVQGTFGYLDPEYFQLSRFTDKSDVYSFGVVLVELLTGKKPISLVGVEEYRSLAAYFTHSMHENRLFDILDAEDLEKADKGEIEVLANLAKRCLSSNGRSRPTMKEVALTLEGIIKQLPHHLYDQENGISCQKSFPSAYLESDATTDATSTSDVHPLIHCQTW